MTMTPAYAMNPENARVDNRTCKCGDKFKAGATSKRAKCKPCYDKAGEEYCRRCAGTGAFITGNTNGIPTGPGGLCFRCDGKGFQTVKDMRRNAYYDDHRPIRI